MHQELDQPRPGLALLCILKLLLNLLDFLLRARKGIASALLTDVTEQFGTVDRSGVRFVDCMTRKEQAHVRQEEGLSPGLIPGVASAKLSTAA